MVPKEFFAKIFAKIFRKNSIRVLTSPALRPAAASGGRFGFGRDTFANFPDGLLTSHSPEAQVAAPVVRLVAGAAHRPAVPGVATPAAAAENAVRAIRRSRRV